VLVRSSVWEDDSAVAVKVRPVPLKPSKTQKQILPSQQPPSAAPRR
jgi:hypothetical protein